MKPVLFNSTETQFTSNGVGILNDAVSCYVDAEINSVYELEMKYPVTGIHFESIRENAIVLAKPNSVSRPQPFRIYRITKPIGGNISVYGRHIAYDLAGIPITPFTSENAEEAMAFLESNAVVSSPFSFETNVQAVKPMEISIPTDCWTIMGKSHGCILNVYGGEYEFDLFTVRLKERIGNDRGISIRYGRNLTSLEQDKNCGEVYTGIFPYWKGTDGEIVTLNEQTVLANGNFDHVKIQTVDFSKHFSEAPTQEQLHELSESYIIDNDIGIPNVSLTVGYVDLSKTEEYKGTLESEDILLGDTVTVFFPKMDIQVTARAVRIKYNVLCDRNESISVGRVKPTISDTIAENRSKINQETAYRRNAFENSEKRIEQLTSDAIQLTARVDGAEAGLRASVKMDLYQDASGKTYHIAYTYVDENGRTVYVDENGIEHYDLTFVGGYASASVMAEIGNVKAGLDSKASIQTVTELSGRVSTIETAENTLTARVGEVESTLLQKAEKTTVTDLQGRVATNESAISSLVTRAGNAESALEQKADSTAVTTLSGRVTTVETAQSNLTARVGKAETSLAQKASSQSVTELSGRVSTIESAETTLSSRVGDAEASLQLKADSSTVSGLSSSVATLSADIAQIQADIIDLNGSVNVNGNLYVSGGNVTSKETISSLKSIVASQNISANGNLSAGGTLRVGGENNYLNFSNGVLSAPTGKFNYLQIGLDTYSPTNITSTSGAVYTVLGAA